MLTAARLLILCAIVFTGCRTAKKAAVTTFRVIDAPARYVRDRIDTEETTTTSTTTTQTTGASDVVNPGRPVPPPPQRGTTRPATVTETSASGSVQSTPRPARPNTASTSTPPSPTPTPSRAATTSSDFPTAKPVPGKPGFVYSVDPNGGMVDVTGYKSGDKARDPYTKQIFIVP